jgi:hypothetical protein
MEECIRSSSLEWTIARTGFLNNANTTDYRFAEGVFPEGGGSISRSALSEFLLTEAKQPSHIKQMVFDVLWIDELINQMRMVLGRHQFKHDLKSLNGSDVSRRSLATPRRLSTVSAGK